LVIDIIYTRRLLQAVLLYEVPQTYRSGQHRFSWDGTVIVLWMCICIGSLRTYTTLWFVQIYNIKLLPCRSDEVQSY